MTEQVLERITKFLFHYHKELKKLLKVARAFEAKKLQKKQQDQVDGLVSSIKGFPLDLGALYILENDILGSGLWAKMTSVSALPLPTVSEYVESHLKPALKLKSSSDLPVEKDIATRLSQKPVIQKYIKSKLDVSNDFLRDRINMAKSDRLIKVKKMVKIRAEKAKGLSHKIAAVKSSQNVFDYDGEHSDRDDESVDSKNPARKNRMGQRARRKMWEEKFGEKAKHLKSNLKAKNMEEKRPNPPPIAALHPSWQSKKAQKQSIQPFSGTKIVFD